MLRIFHDIAQNTDEWMALRMGRFTSSSFKDLFMGKTTAGYEKAIYTPVYERLTGERPEEFRGNFATDRGHDLEPMAVENYEMETFNETFNGGFWELGDWIGCSPDRLVEKDGLFEAKAPLYNTMMNYLLNNELPKAYYWQVHGQMYVTDRAWCDFYAYHPMLPTLLIRINRDEEIEKKLVAQLTESIEKAQTILNQLECINEAA